MDNPHRYELKFVLTPRKESAALSWLFSSSKSKKSFPDRFVNSVYYDSPQFSSLSDNLSGISDRIKYRLRWYNNVDSDVIDGVVFEKKIRTGRLNSKLRADLSNLQSSLLSSTHQEIREKIIHELNQPEWGGIQGQLPALQVRYLRRYFVDDIGIRYTIDTDINYFLATLPQKVFSNAGIEYQYSILEAKFPVDLKPEVKNRLRTLNITPRRHSKYVAGLAGFGFAKYY